MEARTMNAIVIYDSKFGNTERIAKAIGHALADELNVRVQSVDETAAIPDGLELLVIGGPTHAHGMSGPMRAFLQDIPVDALRAVPALAFDTRFRMPRIISGTAASAIGKVLRRKGAKVLLRPESFFVSRSEGNPLEPGEQERATAWARDVIAFLAHAA
jgi:flavorubredoxin